MKKILEDIKKVFESKASFRILCGIGTVVVALLIFAGGVSVGLHQATFGRDWQDHYNENFGVVRPPYTDAMRKIGIINDFPIAHGSTGKIIKLELPNIIVEDKDNTEKTISIASDTTIEQGKVAIQATDLKIDDFIVAIGTPDTQGIIEAKFIRVIPSPELLNQ